MARGRATNKTTTIAKEPTSKDTQKVEKVEKEAVATVAAKADTVAEKAEPAKPAAKKPAARKTTTRKTATRKTAGRKAVKKETTDVKPDVFVQFGGQEYSEKSIMEKVVSAWEAEGKKPSAIKRIRLYVKPEEGKAYYVINEKLKNGSTGAVDL